MKQNKSALRNSLAIGARELDALLDRLDSSASKNTDLGREFVRMNFRNLRVVLTLENSSGGTTMIPVVAKDISRGGISLLHRAYVYPGSLCTVSFVGSDEEKYHVRGKIARCTHRGGKVHEVGISFDENLDVQNLLGLDAMDGACALEKVDPTLLRGWLLVVCASRIDSDLIVRQIEDTKLCTRVAKTIDDAIVQSAKGCDIIIVDQVVGEQSGIEIIAKLRSQGINAPALLMTTDESEATKHAMRLALGDGCFHEPIEQHRLLQAFAEQLIIRKQSKKSA